MMNGLKYIIAFASAFALMLAFRTLACSIHAVTGNGLAPCYQDGDCLLINRCSYGLRIPGNALLPYSRLMRRTVERGDVVAFQLDDDRSMGVMIARCKAVPGDTIRTVGGTLMVPGRVNCAEADYYWLEALSPDNPADSRHLGFIHESSILGRVVTVLYNRKNIHLQ